MINHISLYARSIYWFLLIKMFHLYRPKIVVPSTLRWKFLFSTIFAYTKLMVGCQFQSIIHKLSIAHSAHSVSSLVWCRAIYAPKPFAKADNFKSGRLFKFTTPLHAIFGIFSSILSVYQLVKRIDSWSLWEIDVNLWRNKFKTIVLFAKLT